MLKQLTVLVVLGALELAARANPASLVAGGKAPEDASAPSTNDSVDVITEIDYAYELDSSSLVRERVGNPSADPNAPLPTVRDLKFRQFRHTITPRFQIGVFNNTFVTFALPIVIQQAREITLDEGVDRAGSTAVTDGLISANGFDSRDPGTATTGDLMFRGPVRHGLDQVHVGLGIAPMNQAQDPTKPTWKIGVEARLAVGKVMRFDPMAPEANKGVSEGMQQLKLWTTFAKKLGWAEPWAEMHWLVPLTGKSSSLFDDPGYGATNWQKSPEAGIGMGVELYAVDKPADQTRISLDLGGRADVHFEGREYTELWELFAYAGDPRLASHPLALNPDPTDRTPDATLVSHPGITNIENYLETTASFALRAQIGPHVRFAVTGDLVWKTDHAITFTDAGIDRPTDDNDLVNPGTDEVNPLHVPAIDLVGHRYRSENGFDVVLGVQGQVTF
ncbi:MAG: hypothetical protein HOV81_44230 [Kofleriaceae bacterium]|nr:hypothetical protein [Kofleriaceae bacterium]